jgi:hypothetical protein
LNFALWRNLSPERGKKKKHWSFKEDKMVKKGWQGAGIVPRLFLAFFLIFKKNFCF